MRALRKLAWVELKLFVREPVTMVFTFALPLIFLFVMGEVFGSTPDPTGQSFRGIAPTNYYVPSYVGLVICSIGVIGLPVHLAGYRERGVLRRLRASSVPVWTVFGSQLAVSLAIAALGTVLLGVSALLAYHVDLPRSPALVLPAFLASLISFTALGVLLGALLPTTRAAQGAGLLLFFVMLLLSGAGPPRDVMTTVMKQVGNVMPLTHVTILLQDPWLGFGWNMAEFGIVAGIAIVCAVLSWRFFRWE